MNHSLAPHVLALSICGLLLGGCASQRAAMPVKASSEPATVSAASPVAPDVAKAPATQSPGRAAFSAENQTWFLINLPVAVSATGANSRDAFIRFEPARGRMEGHTGCNPIEADYSIEAQSIRIRNVKGSHLSCADIVTFEALFIQLLSDAVTWEELPDGRLVLKNDGGFPLAVFRKGNR